MKRLGAIKAIFQTNTNAGGDDLYSLFKFTKDEFTKEKRKMKGYSDRDVIWRLISKESIASQLVMERMGLLSGYREVQKKRGLFLLSEGKYEQSYGFFCAYFAILVNQTRKTFMKNYMGSHSEHYLQWYGKYIIDCDTVSEKRKKEIFIQYYERESEFWEGHYTAEQARNQAIRYQKQHDSIYSGDGRKMRPLF